MNTEQQMVGIQHISDNIAVIRKRKNRHKQTCKPIFTQISIQSRNNIQTLINSYSRITKPDSPCMDPHCVWSHDLAFAAILKESIIILKSPGYMLQFGQNSPQVSGLNTIRFNVSKRQGSTSYSTCPQQLKDMRLYVATFHLPGYTKKSICSRPHQNGD